MTAKANGVPILGHAPPPLEGEWVIASDGRRDYLGRVVSDQADGRGVERAVEFGDHLELDPAYEFICLPLQQKVETPRGMLSVPVCEAQWFAVPLLCACDRANRAVYIIRPVSIVPVPKDAAIMRRRLADAVQFAESIRAESAERHGEKPLVVTP